MFFKPNAVTRSALLWGLKTALVIGALILPAAYAENACGAKASLHNPNARNGGIGGTGAPALLDNLPADSMVGRPGIGGTGAAEGGIGGTGLIGVITGFASICVNGVEVHYDTGTPVSADGLPMSLDHLAVGQVVAVQAIGEGDQLSARSISIMRAAVGPDFIVIYRLSMLGWSRANWWPPGSSRLHPKHKRRSPDKSVRFLPTSLNCTVQKSVLVVCICRMMRCLAPRFRYAEIGTVQTCMHKP